MAGRRAGVLLHPTSLPGQEGIGALGDDAFWFIDRLAEAGQRIWQVLPLGPTGYGDSPYAGLSAFAGNPFLISLGRLRDAGMLRDDKTRPSCPFPETHVDFGRVTHWKAQALRAAFDGRGREQVDSAEFRDFEAANAHWLGEFALYAALKQRFQLQSWQAWPEDLARRHPDALADWTTRLTEDIRYQKWLQFTVYEQWRQVKRYANDRGIVVMGDIPIFVAYDSADVWSRQQMFKLDEGGSPTVVAGVPPDYFSPTGQLWGNPHYRWDVLRDAGFDWWVDRFRTLSRLVDIVRLDHFRGFAGAWEVPAGHQTAEHGEWVAGPGADLFEVIRREVGGIDIVAEDLGVITPDVIELRNRFGFPGMHILQFAFASDAGNEALPHNYVPNSVTYTGTHDNDTSMGWWTSIPEAERARVRAYAGTSGLDVTWDLMRLSLASVSLYSIVPLQDVLRLGTAARMNLPGRPAGNWAWRFRAGDLTDAHTQALRALTETYGRAG